MSISEKQYYEAKKFMTVYSDAYQIIEYVSHNLGNMPNTKLKSENYNSMPRI